jgi:hypothetical protein
MQGVMSMDFRAIGREISHFALIMYSKHAFRHQPAYLGDLRRSVVVGHGERGFGGSKKDVRQSDEKGFGSLFM